VTLLILVTAIYIHHYINLLQEFCLVGAIFDPYVDDVHDYFLVPLSECMFQNNNFTCRWVVFGDV
jgi:hypothetical protein